MADILGGPDPLPANSKDGGCLLLAGAAGLIAQVTLGLCVVSSLWIKRKYFDKTKRTTIVWFFDVFKQCVGAGTIHICNLILGEIFHRLDQEASQCAWYLISGCNDVLLGSFLAWLMLKISEQVARTAWGQKKMPSLAYAWGQKKMPSLAYSGDYGDYYAPSPRILAIQTTHWCLLVVIARCASAAPLYLFLGFYGLLASAIDLIFKSARNTELVAVMVLGPLLLNAFQFWLVDSIVKLSERGIDRKRSVYIYTNSDGTYYSQRRGMYVRPYSPDAEAYQRSISFSGYTATDDGLR
eukprot:g4422.t1